MRRQWRQSEELLTTIGRVTVYFNFLEMTLTHGIWNLIFMVEKHDTKVIDHRLGQIITAELSFKQKMCMLGSLYRHILGTPESLPELKSLLKRTEQAEAIRNKIIHSVWFGSQKPGILSRLKYTAKGKAGLKEEREQMTVKEVDEDAYFIEEVAHELGEFLNRDPRVRRFSESFKK